MSPMLAHAEFRNKRSGNSLVSSVTSVEYKRSLSMRRTPPLSTVWISDLPILFLSGNLLPDLLVSHATAYM